MLKATTITARISANAGNPGARSARSVRRPVRSTTSTGGVSDHTRGDSCCWVALDRWANLCSSRSISSAVLRVT